MTRPEVEKFVKFSATSRRGRCRAGASPFAVVHSRPLVVPMFTSRRIPRLFAAAALAVGVTFGGATAQNTTAPVARFLAETAGLASGPAAVRIDILAWSSDEDRSQFVNAWNLVAPVEGRSGAAGGRGGGGRGARGGAAGEAPESGAAPAGGRGARGGRGGPPAGAIVTPAAAPRTPDGALAAALQAADGVGYLWSSESVGYSLRYAHRMTQADGSVRMVLATDRRLGSFDGSWKPATGVRNDYAFTVIELRLNPAMLGEGKTSLTGRVFIDEAANTIALEDYAALPVTMRNVRPAHSY
jgi:hypothetical protein